MKIIAAVVALFSILPGLGACWATEAGKQTEQPGSKLDLSRKAFIEELVYPQGTSRTPRFDDYTPGSYHIRKLDLVEGVHEFNGASRRVEALLVLGPGGPLWQYNVVGVVSTKDPNIVSINHLVFPHARITYKSTYRLSREDYVKRIASILSNVNLREPTEDDRKEDGEWKNIAVVATFGEDGRVRVLPFSIRDEGSRQVAEQFYAEAKKLLGAEEAITTYSHGIKE